MKLSDVISNLNEILEVVGDVEVKLDAGYALDICREVYFDYEEFRSNQFVVLSKNELGWSSKNPKHRSFKRK